MAFDGITVSALVAEIIKLKMGAYIKLHRLNPMN